jgi:hypothetical protein
VTLVEHTSLKEAKEHLVFLKNDWDAQCPANEAEPKWRAVLAEDEMWLELVREGQIFWRVRGRDRGERGGESINEGQVPCLFYDV